MNVSGDQLGGLTYEPSGGADGTFIRVTVPIDSRALNRRMNLYDNKEIEMEPVTNKLTPEQQTKINEVLEGQHGLSLVTLHAKLEQKVLADPAFEQAFAKSPGEHVKQIIEAETGNALPEDFVSTFEQGTKKGEDSLTGELKDGELAGVAGGAMSW